jgi:hypothetical protein
MWTVDWTPSQCRPMDCHGVPARMQLCLSDGNCTQIATGSTSVLEMDALLEVLNVTPWWTGGENNDVGNCTAQIVSAQTDQTRIPASLLCNCPIRCPAVAAPISSELDNNSSLSSSADLLPVEQQTKGIGSTQTQSRILALFHPSDHRFRFSSHHLFLHVCFI